MPLSRPVATAKQATPLPTLKRRAADMAYDRIETLISKLVLVPGSPIVEAEVVEMIGLGRTPVREALMRMVSIGLAVQQPRRGLLVSSINVAAHLDVIATRRVLETLIAAYSARRATKEQRTQLVACAEKMIEAAARGNLDDYMIADQELDHVNHAACRNSSAVKAVVPLIVQCRRFWYAYREDADIAEAARAHFAMAEGIATGHAENAILGANQLMDYLERFTRHVIDN
jgi:DNA-binding GntR family transcriptional regulator